MTQEAPFSTDRPRNILSDILKNKREENKNLFPQSLNRFIEIFGNTERPVVIAEIKPKSPSQGNLFDGDPIELLRTFEQGDTRAISVLTDEKYFGGSPELFSRIRQRTDLPMLWKDFVIHPGQVLMASERKADAILLIVNALNREGVELKKMVDFASKLNLAPVVEVYYKYELEQVIAIDAQIIAVNSRNLDTLDEDLDKALQILSDIPSDRIALLFSSIKTREDVWRAKGSGAKGVLVGTSILKAENPLEKLRELTPG